MTEEGNSPFHRKMLSDVAKCGNPVESPVSKIQIVCLKDVQSRHMHNIVTSILLLSATGTRADLFSAQILSDTQYIQKNS